MRYLLGALIVGAVVLLILHLLGGRMPREHRASRSRRIRASPPRVFRAITDERAFTQWRSEVRSVDTLDEAGGKRRYRENGRHGAITFEVTEESPGSRLVTTIIDEGQPFGGRWTTELRPVGEETEVTITEDGFVNPPIFRFLSAYVFGQTGTIDTYLGNLEKKFSEGPP